MMKQTKEQVLATIKGMDTLSLQQLKERTGIDRAPLSRILSGKANPSLDTLLKITNALNLRIQIVKGSE